LYIDLKNQSIMDSAKIAQVDVFLEHPPFGPLSLWERVRVRGFSRGQTKTRTRRVLFVTSTAISQPDAR
jgi:hypothetical protein